MKESAKKADEQLESLRFQNRSLNAEVLELKKDSTCMGQLLEEEVSKVDKVADRERALNLGHSDLKAQKQEIEA